ncbi:methyltransferase regulatory domain-containing protein [Neoroseomonas oryzicola]|uniref:Methyltransferase domain-containing protein n=1 Tax=Neoroseomonas oryzicola TaxID=535904 RepID=A0A9X9WN01_9PROT|nr:methyltransferase domain-containing protein [Neoroseomonas oryzicola]NKE17211.1 methyltransferase domain-containing protein [Neoroseomonas oryzicola]
MTHATARYGAAHVRGMVDFESAASPARLHLALAIADTDWEPRDRDRLTVLDIGCGRGTTALLLAAANPGWDVIGLDLQPAHVAEAREIAAEAGLSNLRVIEADLAGFDEACAARLLPEVDIVICRGVWTSVPDVVRQGIVALLKSRLRPGGLVLMGYNALPGSSGAIVLQRLLHEAARGMPGTEPERSRRALAVLQQLREIGSPYLPPPKVLDGIIGLGNASPAYMAHEWFTGFWRPVFHADLAKDLSAARLEFGGPAWASAGMADLQLRPQQQQIRKNLPEWMHPETTYDLFLERRVRTDIFVRGRRPGGRRRLGEIRFAMAGNPDHATMRLPTQAGQAALPEPQQRTLLEALARGPRTLAELAALPGIEDLTLPDIAVMLADTNTALPLWRDPSNDTAMSARAARCNAALVRHFAVEASAANSPLGAVCEAFGSAFPISGTNLAIVVALQSGVPADPDLLARDLAPDLENAETLAALRKEIDRTLALYLGAWRALGVV